VAPLQVCLSTLPDTYQRVLELRTGLGSPRVLTRAQVAASLGLPVSRIPLLESRALNQLRSASRSGACAAPAAAAPASPVPASPAKSTTVKHAHKHGSALPLILLAIILAGALAALGWHRIRRSRAGAGAAEPAPSAGVAGDELRCPSCGESRLAFNGAQGLFRCRACGAQGPLAETTSRPREMV
jgi:hypothetical protein